MQDHTRRHRGHPCRRRPDRTLVLAESHLRTAEQCAPSHPSLGRACPHVPMSPLRPGAQTLAASLTWGYPHATAVQSDVRTRKFQGIRMSAAASDVCLLCSAPPPPPNPCSRRLWETPPLRPPPPPEMIQCELMPQRTLFRRRSVSEACLIVEHCGLCIVDLKLR